MTRVEMWAAALALTGLVVYSVLLLIAARAL